MAICLRRTAEILIITLAIISIHRISNKGNVPFVCRSPSQDASAVYMVYFAGLVIVVVYILHETI